MEFVKSADVVVIGGGIVGTAVLRELSKYDLKCVLLEKEPDIAIGTTKANSAILHAGFDAPTGSLKAITNVRGNALYHELQNELDRFPGCCNHRRGNADSAGAAATR